MRSRLITWLLIGCCPPLGGASAWAAGSNTPLTAAEMLVDLARGYALSQGGQQTDADVEHVRAMLRAALRLDPRQIDAYTWLYELAMLAGDENEAARMLAGLVSADPTNESAFALWLQAGVRVHQTAEERARWLRAVADSRRPPAMLALVHVELARLAIERIDLDEARKELESARRLDPACLEAAVLAMRTSGHDARPAERLRAALLLLQVSPLSTDAAWQAGLILNEYGFPAEAGVFYDHARELLAAEDPLGLAPGSFLLDLARNRLARGQLDQAIEDTRQAIRLDPIRQAEAGMLLYYLLMTKGSPADAGRVRDQLDTRFEALREPASAPINELAQAAWFYCTIGNDQLPRALMLAEAAAQRVPSDPFVQRVLGWAQALNEKTDQARATLAPLANDDAYAAGLLATLDRNEGNELGAAWTLAGLELKPTAGPALDLLRALGAIEPTTQPSSRPASAHTPVQVEIHAALADFDRRILAFHRSPETFLEARVSPDDLGPAPGEPWRATLSLTNRGPFTITLGPDGMVNPVFLLSFETEGDRKRDYPALMAVSVDRVRALRPGQSVSVPTTLDVGPLRRLSRQTPQHLQRIVVQAILDAETSPDGKWGPSAGGQRLRTVYFNRVPTAAGPAAMTALFGTLIGVSDMERVRAVQVIADLLGEQQRAELGRLKYRPEAVPADRLRTALLGLLDSRSWELRVRTLDALQTIGLDRTMRAAVEACLRHEHWLVRMLALRVMARQGDVLSDQIQAIARDDPDELVRALAKSYLDKWRQHSAVDPSRPAR